MKSSRRLLLGTFVAMLVAPVALIAYSRFSDQPYAVPPVPERTSAGELAALRDFTKIAVTGDFELDVVRGDTWSVTYTPLASDRGNFTASVEDGTLTLEGFDNRTESSSGTVRITLPDLDALQASFVPSPRIAIRNFNGDTLELDVDFTQQLVLENNQFDSLDLTVQQAGLVEMRGNSFGTTRMNHFGTTITTD